MKIIASILLILLASCVGESPECEAQANKYAVDGNVEYFTRILDHKLIFLKETKTNLCFAAAGAHSFTNVPCSPEVEKLAYKFSAGDR